jgi:hypothetical protein
MIVVGSRCGGFDFYAVNEKLEKPLWLGPSETSDFDVFADDYSLVKNSIFGVEFHYIKHFKTPNTYHGFEFPYLKDGKLHIPKSMEYLCYKIRKKIRPTQRRYFIGLPFDIHDKYGFFVKTIIFNPIPRW